MGISAARKVIVLGSINVDLLVQLDRLPREGETVHGRTVMRQLGGKGANQAVGAARAQSNAILLAAVGKDADGADMISALQEFGVDTSAVRAVPVPTGCAVVATSPNNNQIIVIAGANASVTPEMAETIPIGKGDVCVVQMETPAAATITLFKRARGIGATTIFNPAPASADALAILPYTDVLVVNESELRIMADAAPDAPLDDAGIRARCWALAHPVRTVIVTLGPQGVALVAGDQLCRIPPHRVNVKDTTGAGECFCGYLAAAIARGDEIETAALEANAAAAISVQALGAAGSIPSLSMTRSLLRAESEPKAQLSNG